MHNNSNKHSTNTADGSDCSTQAIVRPESTGERQSTWIEAKDVTSGRVLRCEVFVDRLVSINVSTTTKKFYHSDLETLSVQAFDAEGIPSSSLPCFFHFANGLANTCRQSLLYSRRVALSMVVGST
jgi:hypothetical protein